MEDIKINLLLNRLIYHLFHFSKTSELFSSPKTIQIQNKTIIILIKIKKLVSQLKLIVTEH